MKVIVTGNKGVIEGVNYPLPLTQNDIPDGEYQGYVCERYATSNRLGGVVWHDGVHSEIESDTFIRITNYNPPIKQKFEKHINLTKHIERMANTGKVGNTSEWSDFLSELNKAVI